jgi:hypothetical protein
MMARPTLSALALLLAATPLAAQMRSKDFPSWRAPAIATDPAPQSLAGRAGTPGLVLAGLGGGTVGFFSGLFIGGAIGGGNRICGDDACGLEEAAYGAVIGETALLPLGVHLANHRRGNYGLSLLASAGVTAVGLLAIDASNDGSPLIAIPIAQLITSILIERATGD